MITILIAEDAEIELQMLKNSIDYPSMGMQLVGTARDGMTAEKLLQELRPDILITDIVMPKQSGLQLLKNAKKLCPGIFVVIISGHQSFEYAQKAIEYGVDNFLTKPFFPEQIRDVLTNISIKIQQRNRKHFEDQLFSQEWEKNLPLLQELFIRSLIKGTYPKKLDQLFLNYGIHLKDTYLSSVCILPEERNDITKLSLRKSVTDFFGEENRPCACASLAPDYSSVLCVLFQCREYDSADSIYSLAERLRIAILTEGGFSVSIGTGSIGTGYTDLSICANQALQALDYRYFLGAEKVVAFQDVVAGEHTGSPQLLRQLFPAVLLAINQGDAEVIDDICNKLYQAALASTLSNQLLQNLFAELLSRILSYRYETNPDRYEKENPIGLYDRMMNTDTPYDMVALIKSELITTHKSVDSYIAGRKEWLVNNIKEIIHNQYAKDLSIDDIAKQVFISTGYATLLFRKHTGESINAYLMRTRMEVAAEILKDPAASIGETAVRVGYKNIPYFSSVFRKKYGYTPREWRDMHAEAYEK